jgi:NAD(P)-dependent dehydrogenase (short-subunit alcohol dehydrogenase family)
MSLRFDEQVAIVTGGGKGLGREYALQLAARGARVLVNNRARAGEPLRSADATVQMITAAGGVALANHCNVEDDTAPRQMLAQALGAWGRVDIVIHNAGVAPGDYFTRMRAADFEAVMRINFFAPVALTRVVLPHMRARGYGRMVFSTSAAGLYGNRGQSAYSASKAALLALMQSIRLEERDYDFRVNAIAPFADTQMTAGFMPGQSDGRFSTAWPAALALWFAHRDCGANGDTVIAGGGVFRAARCVEGEGLHIATPGEITPEHVAQHYAAVRALDPAITQDSADGCFRRVVAATDSPP